MSASPSTRPPPAGPAGAPEHVTGYRDLLLAGRGASSVVYRAVQEAYDRTVALKILTTGADEAARRRFLDEVRLTARLTGHPHLVTVLDAGMTWSGQPYLATEFFEAGTLADRLRSAGALPPEQAARIGAKIAEALAAAHAAGITHRDVKPSNILLSGFGEPALADFGVAALQAGGAPGAGPIGFTPLHAAPEVLAGAEPDVAADIYALGSTLYELAAGRPAFSAADLAPLTTAVAEQEPPPLPGEAGSTLDAVIRRAMAKHPEDRWPSAGEFARALRKLEGAGAGAGPGADPAATAHSAPRIDAAPTGATYPNPAPCIEAAPAADPCSDTVFPAPVPADSPPAAGRPSLVVELAAHAARPLWERPVDGRPPTPGDGRLSATMLRADHALHAEPDAPEPKPNRGRVVLTAVAAAVLGAGAAFAVAALRGRPAPAVAAAPPPTSSASSAAPVASQAMAASRPTDVVVTPEADKTKARLDWHIAPGNDHALAVQIQAALGGSRPQTVMVPAQTSSYEVTGLDPSVPGYCFAVGAVVAWGAPSQVAWSAPRCTPGARVVAPTSNDPTP